MKFVLIAVLLLFCGSIVTEAQSCLTQEDVRQLIVRVDSSSPPALNKKLTQELLKMAHKQRELLLEVVDKDQTSQSAKEKLHNL